MIRASIRDTVPHWGAYRDIISYMKETKRQPFYGAVASFIIMRDRVTCVLRRDRVGRVGGPEASFVQSGAA